MEALDVHFSILSTWKWLMSKSLRMSLKVGSRT